MAELHIIGQLEGASGFGGDSIFCKARALRTDRAGPTAAARASL